MTSLTEPAPAPIGATVADDGLDAHADGTSPTSSASPANDGTGDRTIGDRLPGANTAGKHLGLALAVICGAQLMVVLDATVVNVAIPSIHRALHFSSANLEWLITAYALTFGGLLLFGGRTGDLYGKRKMFMIGIAIFASASLLGGLATDQLWLIVTRGLQGVGGAIAAPTALSLIATNFPEGQERNRAMGVYAVMSGGGSAVGLLLGGVLTTYVSWRWIFFVNVPIAAVILVLAPRSLNESSTTSGKLDVPGAVTATGGMMAFVYGLTNASSHSWGSISTVLPLVLAAVLLGSFLLVERRHLEPLMPLTIFSQRNRSGAYGVMLCLGTAIFSMFFFLSQYMQNIHGYSAIRTGVAFLPMTVSIVVAAGLTSRLVGRIGVRVPLIIGPAMAFVGLAWMTRLTATSGYVDLAVPLVFIAFGMGLAFVPLTLSAVAGVRPDQAGLASALLNTSQQVGGALGLAVLGTVAATVTAHILTRSGAGGKATGLAYDSAVTHGYTDAFTVAAGMALAAVVIAVLVIRPDRGVNAERGPAPVVH